MWPLLSWVELFSWKADGLEKRGLGPTAATDAAGSKNKTKHAIRVILGATCLESGRQRPAPHASTGQFGSPKSRVGTRIKCTPSTTCDSLAQEPQQGSASPCSKIASCSPLAGLETWANAAPTPFEGDRPCQNGGLQHRTVCSESFPHTGKARLLPVQL